MVDGMKTGAGSVTGIVSEFIELQEIIKPLIAAIINALDI